jgi:hypothetical protein
MKIAVLPDTQVKPGHDVEYLVKVGEYLADKKPEVIVHLGDHWDMPSLSSYDVGKKSFEGRRYVDDIESGNQGMRNLFWSINRDNIIRKRNKKAPYSPRTVFLMGNHENRVNRAVEADAKLEGVLSTDQFALDNFEEVYNFLDVAIIEGVAFSHYFVTGVAGRPASTAAAQFRKTNMSCISGHQQGLQIHTGSRADGALLTSIIAGSCYEHEEDYMGPQGNKHWRGFLMLHDVKDGQFDLMPVSLDYINKRYE